VISELDQFCGALKEHKSVLVMSHISPDADAAGSAAACSLALGALGIHAVLHLPDPLSESLLGILRGIPFCAAFPDEQFDAVLCVDTADKKRVSCARPDILDKGARSFNLDHHHSNGKWADCNYVRPEAPASAVLVHELFSSLQVPLDARAANLLYAGLLDDTGCFCFSNAGTEAFSCALALVSAGAVPQDIANMLYFSVPERIFRLRAYAAGALRCVLGGRVAVIRLPLAALKQCGAGPEDTEGLVDIARSVSGVIAAVLMRELEPGLWKLSLRSKSPELDVHQIASSFGGGGHKAAAGCRVQGSAEQVEEAVLAIVSAKLPAAR